MINILVVDDELSISKMLKKILTSYGYRVTTMNNGNDALEAFRKTPDKFDLVVSDMTMPKMTGLQLASEIRAIKADFPIIVCSGFSDQIKVKDPNKLGISLFIEKPISSANIALAVRKVLEKNSI